MKSVLVKNNECCLDLAEKALNLIDSKDFEYVSVRPRKSLEIPVIVACTQKKLTNTQITFLLRTLGVD